MHGYRDDGGNRFIGNVDKYLPDYDALTSWNSVPLPVIWKCCFAWWLIDRSTDHVARRMVECCVNSKGVDGSCLQRSLDGQYYCALFEIAQ